MDHPESENKLASVDEGSRLCAGHLKVVPSSNEEMCPRCHGLSGYSCKVWWGLEAIWGPWVYPCGCKLPNNVTVPCWTTAKPSQRGEEEMKEKDWRGFMEIYLGKGRIKGIYGDPAKEKLNKLTPKILPWENTNVHLSSLITVHSGCQVWAGNFYQRQFLLAPPGTSPKKCNFPNSTLLICKAMRVCYLYHNGGKPSGFSFLNTKHPIKGRSSKSFSCLLFFIECLGFEFSNQGIPWRFSG